MPLIVVPTPIGNLEDITLRALRALREADVVACEDTRRTIKLLNHYEIKKTLVSYHQHNEKSRTDELIARIEAGERVALVSDAGMPGISDPGYILIKEAIARDLPAEVLPGPNALLPALLLSGLEPQPFTFVGFIEGREGEKKKKLETLAGYKGTLVFYVPPHGLARELAIFERALGDRRAALVREISKVHEEAIRGTLKELVEIAEKREVKGEIVLIIEGGEKNEATGPNEDEWQEAALRMRAKGIFDKEIANVLAERYGIGRNQVKTFLLREERDDDHDRQR